MAKAIAEKIERVIREGLSASHVEVTDESHLHAGHKGAGGGGHYAVVVVSAAFAGKSPIARHRMVNALLADELRGGVIHALAIDAREA